jgi:low molecular weight protein-tyrosine phosphatase
MSEPREAPLRILFVCLGNICRSPSAEAVMRAKVARARLENAIEVDSAGTGDWHVGEAPDPRARSAASARGFSLESLARQVQTSDFAEFDVIIAMDRANLRALQRLAPAGPARAELRLLREFEPSAAAARGDAVATGGEGAVRARDDGDPLEVPDPYYGGSDGFDRVLDLLEASCDGLLEELVARLQPVAREDDRVGTPEARS